MTLPRATMVPMGNGVFSGKVEDHPCADTTVRVTTLTHDRRRVKLYQGNAQVGEGFLRRTDGGWIGTVSEFSGTWWLDARRGSTELLFHETAPAETAA